MTKDALGLVDDPFDVTNTGQRRGDETVQLYLHDDVASVAQPVRRLVRFERIGLDEGERGRCASSSARMISSSTISRRHAGAPRVAAPAPVMCCREGIRSDRAEQLADAYRERLRRERRVPHETLAFHHREIIGRGPDLDRTVVGIHDPV